MRWPFDRERAEEMSYAVLRIISGGMFMFHGMPKVLGWLGTAQSIGSQKWYGGLIELAGGLGIALGLGTRIWAVLASGTMAVAYFQFHWKLDLDAWKFLPMVNRGELAVMYCFVFLLFALRGAGIWSLDRALANARRPPPPELPRAEARELTDR